MTNMSWLQKSFAKSKFRSKFKQSIFCPMMTRNIDERICGEVNQYESDTHS